MWADTKQPSVLSSRSLSEGDSRARGVIKDPVWVQTTICVCVCASHTCICGWLCMCRSYWTLALRDVGLGLIFFGNTAINLGVFVFLGFVWVSQVIQQRKKKEIKDGCDSSSQSTTHQQWARDWSLSPQIGVSECGSQCTQILHQLLNSLWICRIVEKLMGEPRI